MKPQQTPKKDLEQTLKQQIVSKNNSVEEINQNTEFSKYQTIEYSNARELELLSKCIIDLALNGPTLYHHNFQHGMSVWKKSSEYAKLEEISNTDKFLLSTAAIMHDRIYIAGKAGKNESDTSEYVRTYLPKIGYSASEAEIVAKIIGATDVTKEPENILEAIIKDADTENLGSDEFYLVNDRLYLETITYVNPNLTKLDWYKGTVQFLAMHKYYTANAIKTLQPVKEANIESVKKKIEEMLE